MILAHTPLLMPGAQHDSDSLLGRQAQSDGCANWSVHPTGQRPCRRLVVFGTLVSVLRRQG